MGRHLSRPRLAGPAAVTFETSASRDRRLWLDAGRGTAGVYWVTRATERRLADDTTSGRSRQARLHLRKHVDGVRVSGLERVAGERTVRIETSGGLLVLRFSGPAPALTLARDGEALATLGDGPAAWPPPDGGAGARVGPARPGRVRVSGGRGARPGSLLEEGGARRVPRPRAGARRRARRRPPRRSPTSSPGCTSRGPRSSFPGPPSRGTTPSSPTPTPCSSRRSPSTRPGRTLLHPDSWGAAAALFLEARRRGLAFERRHRAALGDTRRRIRRLEQLEKNLGRDLGRLGDETALRREAEALLAFGHRLDLGGLRGRDRRPLRPRAAHDRSRSTRSSTACATPSGASRRLAAPVGRVSRSSCACARRPRRWPPSASARGRLLEAEDQEDLEGLAPEGPAPREARREGRLRAAPLPDGPRTVPAGRTQRPGEPAPHVSSGPRRGPVVSRPRGARLPRHPPRSRGPGGGRRPARGGGGGGVLQRGSGARAGGRPRHATQARPPRPRGRRAGLHRPLGDAARRSPRPRGPPPASGSSD